MEKQRGKKSVLKYYIKLYLKITRLYVKTRLQYREDLAAGIVAMILRGGLNLFILVLLFHQIKTLGGYTLNHMIFLYGLYMFAVVPSETLLVNIWYLHMHVNQGTFIKYCLRPIDTMFYYFSEMIEFKSITQLFFAVPVILIYGSKIGIRWSVSSLFFLLFLLTLSSIMIAELYVFIATLSFWVLDSSPLLDLIQQLIDLSKYPINIYNKIIQVMLCTIIPVGCIAYIPMLLLKGERMWLLSIPIIAISIVGVICRILWKKGVKRYSGTGS